MGENVSVNKQKLLRAILTVYGKKINKNALLAAEKGDMAALAAGLDERERALLAEALKDKKKAKDILSSKPASELLKKLSGGNTDG